MELNELKNIWNQLDQGTEAQLKVEPSFMRKVSLQKTQSSLRHLTLGAIVELVVNAAFVIPFAGLAIRYLDEPKFAWPPLLLALMGLLTIAWNVYSLFVLNTLKYQDSITAAQKKLARLDYQNLHRQRTLLYILFPLSWAAILILFCKMVLNLDLYQYPTYLILNMVASVVLVPVVIWVSKKFPDRKKEEVLSFLESIRRFEREED